MVCIIAAEQRDRDFALLALENAGLADPDQRHLADKEVMLFTPRAVEALPGMSLEGDNVFFWNGWDRHLNDAHRSEFLSVLTMAGVDFDECGTLGF